MRPEQAKRQEGKEISRWVLRGTFRRIEYGSSVQTYNASSPTTWHKVKMISNNIMVSVGIGPSKHSAELDAWFNLPKKYR